MLLFYIITLLTATSLLYTWFNSSLPGLVFGTLKKFGLKRKSPTFWEVDIMNKTGIKSLDEPDPYFWTRNDFENFALNKLGLLGELLTCKYCLCYHIVAWTNIIAWILTKILSNPYLDVSLLALLASILSQPILVHIIYNITDRLNYDKHN